MVLLFIISDLVIRVYITGFDILLCLCGVLSYVCGVVIYVSYVLLFVYV